MGRTDDAGAAAALEPALVAAGWLPPVDAVGVVVTAEGVPTLDEVAVPVPALLAPVPLSTVLAPVVPESPLLEAVPVPAFCDVWSRTAHKSGRH